MKGAPSHGAHGPHSDDCAQRIRVLRLAEARDPPLPPTSLLHEIAGEIQTCCGQVPLRAHRLACGWTVAAAVREMDSRCASDGLGPAGVSKRAWQDWEAGKRPNRRNQDLLCRLFGTGPVELGFAQDYRTDTAAGPSTALAIRDTPTPERASWDGLETVPPGTAPGSQCPAAQPTSAAGQGVEWDLVMNAAHESSEHAAAFEAASVGPNGLEQLGEDVLRIAREYVYAPPLPLLGELVRVRDRAYWMLDRTRNPAQQSDLYLVAGQACGLLAAASFDLGYPHAASQQARAARAYGEIIAVSELSAWADGMLASIELWAGRPGQALFLAERGLTAAPAGTCRVRLWCIAARAAALQGDGQRTVEAIMESQRERDSPAAPTGLHDGIGGQFGFDPARQAFSNGSAYLHLGRASDAQAECSRALELYARAAPAQRWYAAEAGARADLAAARLAQRDLAGARDAISDVLTLDPGKRVEGVVRRLGVLRQALASPGVQGREARSLAEEIEDFTATPAAHGLPAPPT